VTTQLIEKPAAREATATLYDRHYRRIRGYCLGQLRDCEEANDAVQATFLYAFSSLQRGVEPREELPWLFTIAHNVCRTRRRSLRRRSRLEADVDLDSVCDTIGRELMRNGRIMRYTAPDDFGAPETAFLACNFWYIDALYQIGRRDEARELFESILARRNAYGLLSEDIHPDAGELWGNIPQTYSMAGIINSATRLSSSWEEAWARD